MTHGTRHHLVLVPGFAAFDMLGPLDYYSGVVEVFRAPDPDLPAHGVHIFEGVPTASVATRARMLARWLTDTIDRGTIGEEDAIHLVGHSTGGLDIRQLVRDLADGGSSVLFPDAPVSAADVSRRIRSVQFISTPHRGTNLARVICATMPLPQLALRAAFNTIHRTGPHLTVTAGRLLRRLRPRKPIPTLTDAAVDALCSAGALGDGYQRARARSVFYRLLRWLNEMATDFSAIADLQPPVPGQDGTSCSPIRRSSDPSEATMFDGMAMRSIVTIAESEGGDRGGLFELLDGVLRRDPPESLGSPCSIRLLFDPESREQLDRNHHDGIVNSVSMMWPDEGHSVLVHADHGDIIGHHGRDGARQGYDFLRSATGFDTAAFARVWTDIRRFALTSSATPALG